MTRRSADGDPRQSIAVRTRSDLKQRLERIAEERGHSLGQEVERRLEASFEDASASKLERYIKNRPGLNYMIGMVTPLELTSQLGDVLSSVVRHAEDLGWSEIEAREALAAAWDVVGHYYLWRGARDAPVHNVRPIPRADAKVRDLPPALAGYVIAEEQLLFNAALQDRATYQATVDGKIANVWIGDGKTVEQTEPSRPEPRMTDKRRAQVAAAGGGLIGEEEAARLHAEGKLRSTLPMWFQVLTARDVERDANGQSK